MKFLAALIIALICCGTALAEIPFILQYREYEISPLVGPSFIPKREFSTPVFLDDHVSSRNVEVRYDPGYMIGARVGQNVGDNWTSDLEYTFASQRLNFTNLSPTVPSLSLQSFVHNLSYNGSFMFRPRTDRFRPYVGAGVGVVGYVPGQGGKNALGPGLNLTSSWGFLGNVGGGFKYLVQDGFAFTVDVKDHLSTVPSYGLPNSASVVGGRFQPGMATRGMQQVWQINIGF